MSVSKNIESAVITDGPTVTGARDHQLALTVFMKVSVRLSVAISLFQQNWVNRNKIDRKIVHIEF